MLNKHGRVPFTCFRAFHHTLYDYKIKGLSMLFELYLVCVEGEMRGRELATRICLLGTFDNIW